jgi:hypothetical protein
MKYSTGRKILVIVVCFGFFGCKPDLRVSLTARASYDEGEDVAGTVTVEVSNEGSARARGTDTASDDGYMVDLILSQDNTVPVGYAAVPSPYQFQEDMLLQGGRVSNTEDVPAGDQRTYPGHGGPIPPGSPSTAFLCAVVDPGEKVSESDETNNTFCTPITIAPSQRCVTFEPPPLGTEYGTPAGHSPGDQIFVENGIRVMVTDFRWPSGGTFNGADVRAVTPDFGVDAQFLWMNNINLEFDFTGLGFTPSKVTFHFQDLGGFENFAVNGDPTPVYVGELISAPSPIGSVAFTTSPRVTVPGGYRSVATLEGSVRVLRIGGQEFAIDQVCVQ